MCGPKGKRVFTLDTFRIKEFLDISDACIARLAKIFSPPEYYMPRSIPVKRIDFPALAAEYQRLMDIGECIDKADIARRFGVSRAWITTVFKKANLLT
jgi:hypothetical protein